MNQKRIGSIVFYGMIAMLLAPVWLVDFFVTGDGPCHLHNSRILLDWWDDDKRAFYAPFYYLNTHFDPNWLYNLITMPLIALFGPGFTEKIYFSLYILGFGFGFRFLVNEINPNAKFLSSLALLFCIQKLFMMGFLNNALSFAIWFWVAGWWWRKRNDYSYDVLLINMFLILLLYSAHPLGFTFGLMMIGSMIAGLFLYQARQSGWKESLPMLKKQILKLIISVLPSIILFAEYILRSNLTGATTIQPLLDRVVNICRLSSLVTINSHETIPAGLTATLCGLFFLGAIFLRIKQKKFGSADGLLLFIVFVLLNIIFPPTGISGGLEVSFRMAIIPFIALLCWTATADFPMWAKVSGQLAAFALCLAFTMVRLPVHLKASEYASEIYSCNEFIRNESTLFILNYDWTGQTPEEDPITDRAWLFMHVDCYLGTDKSLIISDNYEAHFPYFPIAVWWNTNMYAYTDKEGINFDHRPPRADILNYFTRTRQHLDYVLMIGYREEFRDHPYTQEIFGQLEQGYERIYESAYKRAVLYRRKIES